MGFTSVILTPPALNPAWLGFKAQVAHESHWRRIPGAAQDEEAPRAKSRDRNRRAGTQHAVSAARTSFTVIDVAALAQVVYVLVEWGTETNVARYTPAILNAGIALILDASVTGALILNKYGTGGFWLWSWFLDAIIVGVGFFSFFLLVVDGSYSSESSNGEPKPWKVDNDVAAWLQLVIA
ncbi:hypothetical protein B0T25DRAFT_569100 [Lasiosphaeria hispida]|uniref:Uncharacterized protein n=1 Tax=Lasiosphaeria hispida TaxID=260671 RepID=A0AAJ0MEY4_9PEZI|nr:hypothetical protein B0T25DRAFT_569100 [Lasiosphaeria hispida]